MGMSMEWEHEISAELLMFRTSHCGKLILDDRAWTLIFPLTYFRHSNPTKKIPLKNQQTHKSQTSTFPPHKSTNYLLTAIIIM
jgi:hypothetical protein